MRSTLTIFIATLMVAALPGCSVEGKSEPTDSTESDIVGGKVDGGYPAVAAIIWTTEHTFCSSFLVAPRVVMTAAHCLYKKNLPDGFFTGPGAAVTRVPSLAHLKGFTRHGVDAAAVNPGYDGHGDTTTRAGIARKFRNDAALLRLTEPLTGVTPLPLDANPARREACTAVGYGAGSDTTTTPHGLLKRSASVGASQGDDFGFSVRPIGGEPGRGDSGSPLLCGGNVTGIYSHYYYADSNDEANDTDFYQQASTMRDWVAAVATSWGVEPPPSSAP